MLMLQKRR